MAYISNTPLTLRPLTSASSLCNKPLTHSLRPTRRSSNCTIIASLPSTELLSANPAALQTVADAFKTLNMPKWLIEWGHPGMMAFMVLAMGLPGAVIGWRGRLNENKKEGVSQKKLHENIMVAFFLLAFFGGTGGTLSVAMQGFDIWETPHFKSAVVCLLLLAANSIIAYSGFTVGNDGTAKGRQQGRMLHAYLGTAGMAAFLIHGILGVNILLG